MGSNNFEAINKVENVETEVVSCIQLTIFLEIVSFKHSDNMLGFIINMLGFIMDMITV